MKGPLSLAPLLVVLACTGESSTDGPFVTYAREKLLDPQTCRECHAQYFDEWSGSMHAYASRDPIFQAMNRRGQEETHGELKNFCVNCHAPMAVVELGDEQPIDPATLDAKLQGVTCYFCHDVTRVGNSHDAATFHDNPLVLANDTTMRGGVRGALRNPAHDVAFSPLHSGEDPRSSTLCGSCHDISVPAHLSGAAEDQKLERTFEEWSDSTFGSGPGETSCNGCHLPRDTNRGKQTIAQTDLPGLKVIYRHLHDFPAVDTAFSDPTFPRRDEQAALIQDLMDKELRVVICAPSPTDPPEPIPTITVELENQSAGHGFPSGASQDRRLWIELHASLGDRTYESGVVPVGASVVAAQETAFGAGGSLDIFRDITKKADGTPAHMFWDVASIEPHTIPAPAVPPELGRNLLRVQYARLGLPAVDRVTVRVRLEPIGLDVIDDLIASGHLDAVEGPKIRAAMPRYTLSQGRLKDPDAGPTAVAFEWTKERADREGTGGGVGAALCLETNASQNSAPARP